MSNLQATPLSILNKAINVFENLYSLNDLHKASGGANKDRPTFFLQNKETQALIAEIERENYNACNPTFKNKSGNHNVGVPTFKIEAGKPALAIKTVRGRVKNRGTYVCKEIVYRYAMWVSPKFALAVIRAFDAAVTNNLLPATITIEQQRIIQEAVNAKAQRDGISHQTIYHDLKTRYRIPRYNELPAAQFPDCLAWLGGYHIEYKNSNFGYQEERTHAIEIMERGALVYLKQHRELEDLWDNAADLCVVLRQIAAQAEALRQGLKDVCQGSGAIYGGVREAQFHLKFPQEILRNGRERAASRLISKMGGEK